MKLKDFLTGVRDALFPQNFTCDLCGKEIFDGGNFCKVCAETVELNNKTVCPVCGRRTARAEICAECKAEAPLFKRGVSALIYCGGGAALINKFKNGAPYLKNYLGRITAEKAKLLPECDFITFVPITAKRKRMRGYNQSRLLAEEVAARLDIPLKQVLEKKRDTADQKSLSKRGRAENLKGSFIVKDRAAVKGKKILVTDDVLTTGATADEVCRQLLNAGAAEIYFATAASVEYKIQYSSQ